MTNNSSVNGLRVSERPKSNVILGKGRVGTLGEMMKVVGKREFILDGGLGEVKILGEAGEDGN